MICEKCGKENKNQSKFCKHCGSKFTNSIQEVSKEKPKPSKDFIRARRCSNFLLFSFIFTIIVSIVVFSAPQKMPMFMVIIFTISFWVTLIASIALYYYIKDVPKNERTKGQKIYYSIFSVVYKILDIFVNIFK